MSQSDCVMWEIDVVNAKEFYTAMLTV
jgi:hypothetical protein